MLQGHLNCYAVSGKAYVVLKSLRRRSQNARLPSGLFDTGTDRRQAVDV